MKIVMRLKVSGGKSEKTIKKAKSCNFLLIIILRNKILRDGLVLIRFRLRDIIRDRPRHFLEKN